MSCEIFINNNNNNEILFNVCMHGHRLLFIIRQIFDGYMFAKFSEWWLSTLCASINWIDNSADGNFTVAAATVVFVSIYFDHSSFDEIVCIYFDSKKREHATAAKLRNKCPNEKADLNMYIVCVPVLKIIWMEWFHWNILWIAASINMRYSAYGCRKTSLRVIVSNILWESKV